LNERKPGNGMTALHYVTLHGNEGCVRLLLKYGARVNAINFNKETPLHHAALYGSSECAKILIESGAKINAKDRIGRTPLHFAAAFGKVGIKVWLKYILKVKGQFRKHSWSQFRSS
jgi:ankyrin repeat protein